MSHRLLASGAAAFFLATSVQAAETPLRMQNVYQEEARAQLGQEPDTIDPEGIALKFVEGDYASLEELRKKLWHSKARQPNGELQLTAFYQAFESIPAVQLSLILAQAEEWHRNKPDSYLAALLLGKFYHSLAWTKLPQNGGSGAGPEQMAAFRAELTRAAELLREAADQKGLDPEVFSSLIAVCGEDKSVCPPPEKSYLDQSIELEPSYIATYRAQLRFFLPQWGGRQGQAPQFAEQVSSVAAPVFGRDGVYAILGSSFLRQAGMPVTAAQFSWERMESGFRELTRRFPSEKGYLYSFGRSAVFALDKETARDLFVKTGSEWNEDAQSYYYSEESFKQFADWALGRVPEEELPFGKRVTRRELSPFALYAKGHLKEAEAAYAKEIEKAEKSGKPDALWSALMDMSWFCGVTGEFREGIRYANQAYEIAQQRDNRYQRGRTLSFIGLYLSSMGYYEPATKMFQEAIAVAAPKGNPVIPQVWGLATQELGRVMFQMGDVKEARRLISETLDFARKYEVLVGISEGATELSQIALSQGNTKEALTLAEEGYEASLRCNCNSLNTAKAILALSQAMLAESGADPERLREAADTVAQGEEYATSVGARPIVAQLKVVRARLLPTEQGVARRTLLEEAVQIATYSETEGRGDAEAALGKEHLQQNDAELAKYYINRGIALNREMFREVSNAYIAEDSAALSRLKGSEGEALKKLAAAYQVALKSDQLPLQFDTAAKVSQDYFTLGYTTLGVEWAERALQHGAQLYQRDASPERKEFIEKTVAALQELLVNGSARVNPAVPSPE